tara:strand:+ start:152 stop:1372 length:1221 start_codon:yes stop_codon:yes gene_type:complete
MASMLLLFYIGAAVASTSHTLVSAAIGWPILDDELGPAFGSTPPALLAAGLQSLCFAQLAIVDGELEDARSAAARFCTAARDPTLRAAMRCWAMATIVVLDTPVTPCESRVAAVLAQRVRLHRVSGGLGDVAASFRVFTAARWHSAAQILSAARAFCNCEGTFLANDATIALRNAEAASIAWAERGSSISSNRREGAPRSAACAATIYVLPLKDEQTIAREVAMIFEGLRALGCVTTRSIEDATWIFDIPSEHEESPRVIRPPELEAKVVTIDVHDTPSVRLTPHLSNRFPRSPTSLTLSSLPPTYSSYLHGDEGVCTSSDHTHIAATARRPHGDDVPQKKKKKKKKPLPASCRSALGYWIAISVSSRRLRTRRDPSPSRAFSVRTVLYTTMRVEIESYAGPHRRS